MPGRSDNKNKDLPLFNRISNKENKTNNNDSGKVPPQNPSENLYKKSSNRYKNLQNQTISGRQDSSEDNFLTLGAYLQEARVKSGYSLSQVAITTKLNVHYIEAIERDDLKNAPPYIYVKAYVKKLCDLYNVDHNKALELLKPQNENDKLVSDSILQELEESKQINEKEEKKIVLIIKIIFLTFLAAVILFLIMYFSFENDNTGERVKNINQSVEKKQVQKKIEKIAVPQTLTPTQLKFSPKTKD
ncbi:MAG: helix-turn-helix domain-containing protein [Victivallales bacterium]|nr:helix-turn-helix domain-containing protein [Victivallales bacterium]MCF7889298.1 helix-turn-helix domain-containing protein [Victivallales bacterium]